eukprot:3916240-Amphidinium_carterae.1
MPVKGNAWWKLRKCKHINALALHAQLISSRRSFTTYELLHQNVTEKDAGGITSIARGGARLPVHAGMAEFHCGCISFHVKLMHRQLRVTAAGKRALQMVQRTRKL